MRKEELARLRESAGSAKAPASVGDVLAIFGCDRAHRLYIIGERGVSSGVMADTIDPARTNSAIPWLVQRQELSYGASSRFIQQTIATAASLLRKGQGLPATFDREDAFIEALEVAHALSEIADTIAELSEREREVRAKIDRQEVSRALLPRTQNIRGRVNQAIGHLADARAATVRLAEMFYPKEKPNDKWADALAANIGAALHNDGRIESIEHAIRLLTGLLDYRNALEHRRGDQGVDVWDYELSSGGELIAPTVEVRHHRSPRSRQDIVQFLATELNNAAEAFEILFVICCDTNGGVFGGIARERVAELPSGRVHQGSRYMWQAEWLTKDGLPPHVD